VTGFRKILVTGGTGLLGHAIQAIAGDYPGSQFVFIGTRDCDLTKPDDTADIVRAHAPDAIVHTAAVAGGIQFSTDHPATLLRDNVLMNLHIVEAARIARVRKTIMTLSTGMYPEYAPLPLREEHIHDGPPHASNYGYSFAKRLIEPMIRSYRREYGMDVIGLVANGIFGEHGNFRHGESVMLAALVRRFHEQRQTTDDIVVSGDGSPLREYTYSQDLARAFLWCLQHYDDERTLHVGSTEEHSVKETAYMIAELLDIDVRRIAFDASRPNGIMRKNTDNSRFLALSRFTYTPFKDALARTIAWFRANYDTPGAVRL
jgi:GDP-L-fucose synthase